MPCNNNPCNIPELLETLWQIDVKYVTRESEAHTSRCQKHYRYTITDATNCESFFSRYLEQTSHFTSLLVKRAITYFGYQLKMIKR